MANRDDYTFCLLGHRSGPFWVRNYCEVRNARPKENGKDSKQPHHSPHHHRAHSIKRFQLFYTSNNNNRITNN